ncbi:hypothetical protein TcBrA4_0023040 [Trypanosoma cruzi]|nr:hypothetical protein TcBrA4_0023040 [Trypanosoma cruzi]
MISETAFPPSSTHYFVPSTGKQRLLLHLEHPIHAASISCTSRISVFARARDRQGFPSILFCSALHHILTLHEQYSRFELLASLGVQVAASSQFFNKHVIETSSTANPFVLSHFIFHSDDSRM